jgi:hypothetical protein
MTIRWCVVLSQLAGEVLLGDLSRAGFQITGDHEDADAIVVNTCAFVEDAKAESLEVCWIWIQSFCWASCSGPAFVAAGTIQLSVLVLVAQHCFGRVGLLTYTKR